MVDLQLELGAVGVQTSLEQVVPVVDRSPGRDGVQPEHGAVLEVGGSGESASPERCSRRTTARGYVPDPTYDGNCTALGRLLSGPATTLVVPPLTRATEMFTVVFPATANWSDP